MGTNLGILKKIYLFDIVMYVNCIFLCECVFACMREDSNMYETIKCTNISTIFVFCIYFPSLLYSNDVSLCFANYKSIQSHCVYK